MQKFDEPVHDEEGQNRVLPVLIGWHSLYRRLISALRIRSNDSPLELDNPLVLAALGVIAGNHSLARWTQIETSPSEEPEEEHHTQPVDKERLLR